MLTHPTLPALRQEMRRTYQPEACAQVYEAEAAWRAEIVADLTRMGFSAAAADLAAGSFIAFHDAPDFGLGANMAPVGKLALWVEARRALDAYVAADGALQMAAE